MLKIPKDYWIKSAMFPRKYSGNWNSVRDHLVIQRFENGLYAVNHFVLLSSMI